MKKACLVILIAVLMASCSTTGGNVFTAKDRTESLIEALSATPITVEKEEPVLPSPEPVTPVTNAPKSEKPEVVEIQEPEPSETETVTEEAPVIPAVSEEEDETEVPAAIPETVEEDVVYTFEDKEDLPVIEKAESEEEGVLIPVADHSNDVPSRLADADEEEPAVIFDEPMRPWMLELMVALIVDIILFTAASAVRNAVRAPLTPVVSAAISLLMTALTIVLSSIIAGWSPAWLSYLLLLFTYYLLRSGRRRRGSR